MEKFTRNQRAEIYLKAAKMVELECFGCFAIENVCNIYRATENDFPEFWLFKPKRYGKLGWFGMTNHEHQSQRELALLFAHQIALKP